MLFDLIYALHGFLGDGKDWRPLQKYISRDIRFCTPSLFSKDAQQDVVPEGRRKLFVGYSFGGRIGLEMLQRNPEQFEHYVFISTNPGLREADTVARRERVELDQKWADKISPANWQRFLAEWNAQGVFQGTTVERARNLEDFDLAKLKGALIERSLGLQPDYRKTIAENKAKISWVVGSRDKKFLSIGEDLQAQQVISNLHIVEAGHRLHLDAPESLAELILSLNKKKAP